MALLLAMYQKMRLIREKNQVTLDLTKYTSKLDRVQKNIEKVQKRYTSLFAQLDSQAKQMQSQANIQIQNMFGLGANCVGINNFSGMNGFVAQTMQQLFASGQLKDQDGNPLTCPNFEAMMEEYSMNGCFRKNTDGTAYEGGWSDEEVKAFMVARNYAMTAQQNAQMNMQTASNAYAQNVSIWVDAQKAQLEAEQDAMLEPLNYQETMWELEKTNADLKLKRINSQLETYDQLVSQESEKSAPTFGLR